MLSCLEYSPKKQISLTSLNLMSLKFSGHGQNTGELYARMSHELPLAMFMIDFLFPPHETT